ncbi:MAG TPA: hypothetical protein VF115_14030 [Acidimicrobiia bacterium]
MSLDLTGDPESDPDVEFICTDLTSDTSVSRAVERIDRHHGSHVASVVHLATFYDFAGEDSPVYDEVTVQGTPEIARRQGATPRPPVSHSPRRCSSTSPPDQVTPSKRTIR